MRKVFLGSEAVAAGVLTTHELRRWHQRMFRDVYIPSSQAVAVLNRIEERHRLRAGAIYVATHPLMPATQLVRGEDPRGYRLAARDQLPHVELSAAWGGN